MLGWLFIATLGIVWAIFLFPFIRRRMRSPVTTVEEFEQKMDFLAETNIASRGRWVLTPRSGERFLGRSGRTRSRVRERRRQVLVLLMEATGLAVLIGLFPPFRRILLGAAGLAGVLLVYAVLLVRIRSVEAHRAQLQRARSGGRMAAYGYETYPAYADGRSNGHSSNGRSANGRRDLAPRAATRSGRGDRGWPEANGYRRQDGVLRLDRYENDWRAPVAAELAAHVDDPVVIIDEDVHIVVHRSDELDLRELRTAAR
jgi:hypothetical protein